MAEDAVEGATEDAVHAVAEAEAGAGERLESRSRTRWEAWWLVDRSLRVPVGEVSLTSSVSWRLRAVEARADVVSVFWTDELNRPTH